MVNEGNEHTQWSSRLVFLMAMIGAAVGLGNIWRYSYVVYDNGGGAFLIPYLVSIVVMALPFLFLEYGMGFKFKTSLPLIFKKIKPKFEFVGWFIALTSFLVLSYYVVIIGWDLIYFILSFFKGWGSNPDFFLTNTLLQSTSSFKGLTNIIWPIVLTLVFIWGLTWLVSHKNLNDGIGRFTQFIIPLLIILMGAIVVFSLFLTGSNIGLTHLLTPNWNALFDFNIWLAAFGQILFSLDLGWGVIATYSSYLPDDSKLIHNGLIVVFVNCAFEFFTALGVFSILGFMSFTQGIPLSQVVTHGIGLIFVAFPTVFNNMGWYAYLIGPVFFLCIFLAGMTTAISCLEPLSLAITKKFNISRSKIVTILCTIGFLTSLLFATGTGSYLLNMFDLFLNEFAIVMGIIVQCIIFAWFYNLDTMLKAINNNSSIRMGKTWKLLIKYIVPAIFFIIWLEGIYTLISTGDSDSILVYAILSFVLTVVPLILTKLQTKSSKCDS